MPKDQWPNLQTAAANSKNGNDLNAMLTKSFHPAGLPKGVNVNDIRSFINETSKSTSFESLMEGFSSSFLPNMKAPTDLKNTLKDLPTNMRKQYENPDCKSMFRQMENKAIVIEGGKNGTMKCVQKMYPSNIDSPGYEAYSNKENHQKASYQLINGMNPGSSKNEVLTQAKHQNVKANDFMFESQKTGLKLGVAICRDYLEGIYKNLANEELKTVIHHLQVPSCGVAGLINGNGTALNSASVNDGLGYYSDVHNFKQSSKNHATPNAHLIKYTANTKNATIITPQYGYLEKSPIEQSSRNITMQVGNTVHFNEDDDSSVESFNTGINSGMVKPLELHIQQKEKELEALQNNLSDTRDLLSNNGNNNNVNLVEIVNKKTEALDMSNKLSVKKEEEAKECLNTYITEMEKKEAQLTTVLSELNTQLLKIQKEREGNK